MKKNKKQKAKSKPGKKPKIPAPAQKKAAPSGKSKVLNFQPELKIYPNALNLFEDTAHLFMETALEAVSRRGRFVTAFSGGTTPKGLFQQLGEEPYRSLMPWGKTYVFWVDERHLPLTSEDSNYYLAEKFLFSKVPIPRDQIFPVTDGNRPVPEAASVYERTLKRFFAGDMPRFDFELLGMGEDGHTASLFPGTPALKELEKWAVGYSVEAAKAQKERVSLTFPVLNAARLAVVLVEGEKKAKRLKDVLEGPSNPPRFPVQYLRPTEGRLLFMMDQFAASLLNLKSH
jgi:6-phosphogluconolactonase